MAPEKNLSQLHVKYWLWKRPDLDFETKKNGNGLEGVQLFVEKI